MSENEKKIFHILENLIILFQRYLPMKVLMSKEFKEIKNSLENLSEKK